MTLTKRTIATLISISLLFLTLVSGCQSPDEKLLSAIKERDTKKIIMALDEGANPNYNLHKVEYPRGEEHYDAKLGRLSGEDYEGMPLIFWAIAEDNQEAFDKIIDKGGNINYKFTPLSLGTGYENITPLFFALSTEGREKYTEKLIKLGANIHEKCKLNNEFVTPLQVAIINGNATIVDLFLEKGADPNQLVTENEVPVFFQAIVSKNLSILKLLINKGANVNLKIKSGKSAIFWAVESQNLDIVKLLLEQGIYLNQTFQGMSVIEFAENYGTQEIKEWLLVESMVQFENENGI